MAKAKQSPLGSGERFKKGVLDMMAEGMSKDKAGAIMASVGRKKYGKKKMADMAAAGRKRAHEKK